MSNGNRQITYIVPEVSYGVTPATPAWKTLRRNTDAVKASIATMRSDELRGDRQIPDFRHAGKSAAGDILVELSFGSHDDLLAGALCGDWVDPGGDAPEILKVGNLRKSWTLMKNYADQAGADHPFHLFRGSEVNTWSLDIASAANVKMTFGFMGREPVAPAATAPAGSTYTAATTTRVFDSFTGSIKEGGVTVGYISAVKLELNNGMEARPVLFSEFGLEPSIAESMLTGSIVCYFINDVILSKFFNETATSLEFTLTDRDGSSYIFKLPNIVYTDGGPETAGPGNLNLTLPFQAILDPTSGTQFSIERVPEA